MKEQRRPTLTLRRSTEPASPASDAGTKPALKVMCKKRIVVSSPLAWKAKKQALKEKAQVSRKAEQEQQLTGAPRDKSEGVSRQIYRKEMPLQEAISLLRAHWPGLVDEGKPQLLAVNIRQTLLEDIRRRELGLSTKKLKQCLAAITRSDEYLDAMTVGAWRINANGQSVAAITADEAMFARARKAQEHARRARKQASELHTIKA
ncbi:fertility inhibition protein FinO [Enterobacter asburiae]|uniref:fertility inhibition protein FinO n=1 Tax=Scandinavium sp. UTDF21-P1B TaxID=3446379 RepID=UPI00347E5B6F